MKDYHINIFYSEADDESRKRGQATLFGVRVTLNA